MTWLLDLYYRFLKLTLGALLALMVVPVVLQIGSRYVEAIPSYIWTEEMARFCFVWIIMIGSMIAVRDDAHFDVDLFAEPDSNRQKGVAKFIVHSLMLLLACIFAWFGIEFTRFGYIQKSEMWGINMASIYVAFPMTGISCALFLLEKLRGDIRLMLAEDEVAAIDKSDGSQADDQKDNVE